MNTIDLAGRRNKYGARRTVVDGVVFDSVKEAMRYTELRTLQKAGVIEGLELKVKYEFVVNDVKIGRYTPDFQYYENGSLVVEDVKSKATKKARDYGLRKKLMLALFGIVVKET